MNQMLAGYGSFVAILRQALFWLAVAVAAVAALDWAVRTRRVNPFGPVARFCRRFVDPLMRPVERRVVHAGGLPSSAPWWTLVFVVLGGLVLIAVLNFVGGFLATLMWGVSSPARLGLLLLSWTFGLLQIALIVRVVSTWIQISQWSIWVRWSYVLTEWMLAPLRRIIPTVGPLDITPLVAFFLLAIVKSVIGV